MPPISKKKIALISEKDFEETKEYLLNGGQYLNETANKYNPIFFITIKKDGERIFYLSGNYKFFKNIDDFIIATIKIIKRKRR